MRNAFLLGALAVVFGGCASASHPATDVLYRTSGDSPPLLDPADRFDSNTPPPANDLRESERLEWYRQNYSWSQPPELEALQERVVYRDRYVERPWYESWALPFTLAIGYGIYRSRRHRDHHRGH